MDLEDINILEEIGIFTKKLRSKASKMLKSGVDIVEIIDFVEKSIFDANYLPAFPCGISINEVAAHYTVFDEGYVLKKGDLVSVDFGVSKNGIASDNAFTVEIESNNYKDMIDANMRALDEALDLANIGVSMGDVGKAVNNIAEKHGFNTIHNLSGHQIEKDNLHCGLSVPNYDNKNKQKIENNMELAIEPFFTRGEPMIKASGLSNHLHLMSDKSIRDPIAKKVLNYIKENYPNLPFSKRWLLEDVTKKFNLKEGFNKRQVNYAIKILKREGIIHEYEKLVSVDGKYVSQVEDTVVFYGNKKKIITR